MKILSTALRRPASLLVLPALLALSGPLPLEEIRFAPAEDTTLSKRSSQTVDLSLDDLSVVVDGMDMSAMMGAFEMNMTIESAIAVTDTYAKVESGRPVSMKRTFDELGGEMSMEVAMEGDGDSQDITMSSELEGRTVVYTWDADEEAYVVRFEGQDDPDPILEGLVEDMDLRFMLPKEPVEVDGSWTIDMQEIANLMMESQSLRILPDEMGEEELAMMEQFSGDDFMQELAELYEGSCTCTLEGVREVDGERLADISVEVVVTVAADLSDKILDVIATVADTQGEEMPEIDMSAADLNFDLDAEGTLVWNLSAGHIQSVDFSGDMTVAFDLSASLDEDGESHGIDASIEMSGTFTDGLTLE